MKASKKKRQKWAVEIKFSNCLICEKKCSADGFGRLPKLCSLECRQTWYRAWDKDWCIGTGMERELSNRLRAKGYSDYEEFMQILDELGKIQFQVKDGDLGRKRFWTLLSITRDLSIEFDQFSDSFLKDKREQTRIALDQRIKRDQEINGDLYVALLDECPDVLTIALELVSNNIDNLSYLSESIEKIESLLKHKEFHISNKAREVLEKVNQHVAKKETITMDEFKHILRGGRQNPHQPGTPPPAQKPKKDVS